VPLARSLSLRVLVCPFQCILQRVSPHSVLSFCILTSPSLCVLSLWVTLTRSLSFRLIEHSLALWQWCLSSMPGLALQWPFVPAPCLIIHLVLQRLGCCSGGFLSPTSGPNAGGALGHGKRSAHNWQRSLVCECQPPRGRLPSQLCWGLQLCQQAQERQDIHETQVHWPPLTASNSKLVSASAAKGGAHAAVLLGTNMALVEILTPHGVGGTNRKFLVSGRPGPRSCHWNTRLAGIAGIKGDRSLG